MKSNELRIGNFVSLPFENDKIYTIRGVDIECLQEGMDSESMQPIIITEEWLLNFGFTRHHSDYYNDVILLKDVFNFDNGEQYDCLKVKIYPHELGSAQSVKGDLQIKYVHQLQNLYFALTGEELTYGGNK